MTMFETLGALAVGNPVLWLSASGLLLGAIMGWLMAATNFCAMGGVSDLVVFGDSRRLRSWLLAGVTAVAGTQALAAVGLVEVSGSMYLAPRLDWLGHIVGGFLFGIGMVLAGGCVSRNLVRAGAGDLRSLLTVVTLGLFAAMASGGVLGPVRTVIAQTLALELPPPSQSLGAISAAALGVGEAPAALYSTLVLVSAGVIWCFASADFRRSGRLVSAGLGVGLVVTAGWLVTSLAYDEVSLRPVQPASLTFVGPSAQALGWLGNATGSPLPGFGTASVFGMLLGAFTFARAHNRFRLQTFVDVADTARSLAGAVLMGFGGVTALGCTIGQGVTGLATLSVGSLMTLVSLVIGGICGVRLLEQWLAEDV